VQVGSIADITIYAPEPVGTIDSTRWFTKARAIDRLYHGRPCQGHVRATIVNGNLAYDGEAVIGLPGTGRFVRPQRS
jgi:dihydroorotase-like cyclic amidohydrolase